MTDHGLTRRDWLKLGGASLLVAGAATAPGDVFAQDTCQVCDVPADAAPPQKTFELEIGDTSSTFVDGESVNLLAFRLASANGVWKVPGPTLRVTEGMTVRIKVTNLRKEMHSFEITGIPQSKTEVAPNCSCWVQFTAPVGGTYIYHDAFGNSPLYRLMGLHGVLVVMPLNGVTKKTATNPYPSQTPYSLDTLTTAQRNAITKVFNALGTTERFLGGAEGKWVPCTDDNDYSFQEKVWVMQAIDPRFQALIVRGQPLMSAPQLTGDIVNNFVPRYFQLNNRSGFDLNLGEDICPDNYIGEPTLIRMVNVGITHHSPHIHGNHVLRLSQANLDPASPDFGKVQVADNIFEVDTWSMWPMERRDMLLPFEIPPDIPYKPLLATDPQGLQFDRMVSRQAKEPFPLRYVMHDHCEMATTAGGGNYPQGMVTHWEIMGGLGGRKLQTAQL